MDNDTLRTLTAAIILGGLLANPDSTTRDLEISDAIGSADALLAALKDPGPLNERIENWRKKAGKGRY